MAILNFTGRVTIADRIVTEKYPGAKIFEVHGETTKGEAFTALDIDKLKVIYYVPPSTPDDHRYTTAYIRSKGWGEFEEPEHSDDLWDGSVKFDWPIDMDLAFAVDLLREAGYSSSFTFVTL